MPAALLAAETGANEGYLAIALRALESIGWISTNEAHEVSLSETADYEHFPAEVVRLYEHGFEALLAGDEPRRRLLRCVETASRWSADRLAGELFDGAVFLPVLMSLHARGAGRAAAPFEGLDAAARAALSAAFHLRGWTAGGPAETASLSELGRQLVERARVMGIAASYRPMLARADDLLFGRSADVFAGDGAGGESHIDRGINVIASGFQHDGYFKDAEAYVVDVFSRPPIKAQPSYIADMGCGDGSFLKQLYSAVRDKSLRGRHLGEHPVTLIAVDSSRVALEQAERTLLGLPFVACQGDINDPERLLADLATLGIEEVQKILHVRSFLDHNFRYEAHLEQVDTTDGEVDALVPDGVHVDERGRLVPPARLLAAYRRYLGKWASTGSRHGILVLEAHSVPAGTVRRHFRASENFYFDTLHALSRQYLVDAETFLVLAANVGLFPKTAPVSYPKLLDFKRITLSLFEKRDYLVRHVRPDDIEALDLLERECWAPELRASRAALEERIRACPQGQLVLEWQGRVVSVIYSQRIESEDALAWATAASASGLHREDGAVVQLIAVNAAPAVQERGFGDQLLELMLQRCSVMNGVRSVVGVTRCRPADPARRGPIEQYIRSRDEHGRLLDPILHFHEAHGAVVERAIPGYRPEDRDNDGHGVLVRYDLHARHRRHADGAPVAPDRSLREGAGGGPEAVETTLRRTIAQAIGAGAEVAYDVDRPLMEMGLDSGDLLGLGEHIRTTYGIPVEQTFFFAHRTPAQVARYIREQLAPGPREPAGAAPRRERERSPAVTPADPASPVVEAIAIVGMACRLPGGANTPAELWSLLESGKSAIGPLPAGRWVWPNGVDPESAHRGIALGGFLTNIDEFDAAFFRISPREAELMDPQQRILLELTWHAIEDAGWSRDALAGTATGVFVGASGSDYGRVLDAATGVVGPHYGTGNAVSVLANRLSYFFDWNGPSLLIDTACSSSLVAVHQAAQALRARECRQAVVAGVNILCHPASSVAYYSAGMLSKDGLCRTFDKHANGYVRAEGAAVLVLKSLADAVRDGDRVYAVLRGSAINHGGQASGLTVPNPTQQARLYRAAWDQAGIAPERIGYVEAHGTGTALGDPIEVRGLREAFGSRAAGARMCGLGSIKTNVGHLEAAAGIAGLLKAILCLVHEELPASLHFTELNPHIDLSGTPFFVVHRHQPWGAGRRIAAVSSFGSGGANAHVVVEAHQALPRAALAGGPRVVVLSAKDRDRLRASAKNLDAHLGTDAGQADLAALAWTLQRRQPMEERAALLAFDLSDLRSKLRRLAGGGASIEGAFFGNVRDASAEKAALRPEDWRPLVSQWIGSSDLERLARAWVVGADVPWDALHGDARPEVISLPGYPFARERFWVSPEHGASPGGAEPGADDRLHPLLHHDLSDGFGRRFASTFTGDELFLAHHVVKGASILPGVAHLEMARRAIAESLSGVSGGETELRFEDVSWVRPVLVASGGTRVHLRLSTDARARTKFEIREGEGSEGREYSHGYACLGPRRPAEAVPIEELRLRCNRGVLEHARCYELFAAMGIDYGPAHRGIDVVHVGDGEALARIRLPEVASSGRGEYALHPSLVDAALQVSLLMVGGALDDDRPSLGAGSAPVLTIPYEVKRVNVSSPCVDDVVWAWTRYSAGKGPDARVPRYDVTLCDARGNVAVHFQEFASRRYSGPRASGELAAIDAGTDRAPAPPVGLLALAPTWDPVVLGGSLDFPPPGASVVIVGGSDAQRESLCAAMPAAHVLVAGPDASARAIARHLESDSDTRYLYWIADNQHVPSATSDRLIEEQRRGVLRLFETVKALLASGLGARTLSFTFVTVQAIAAYPGEAVRPQHASVHGFAGSMAKEQSTWQVSVVDVQEDAAESLAETLAVPVEAGGKLHVRRHGEWLRRSLVPFVDTTTSPHNLPYRRDGVYVVVGGAGGVGETWTRDAIERFGAQVVWIGRRPLTPAIEEKLNALGRLGRRPTYIAADARSRDSLRAAYEQIKARHARVHGIIHSAMVLSDCSIVDMEAARFADVLSSKVDVSVRMAQVFAREPLDFVLFFSSLASFVKNAKQSHYTAGCSFEDSFAQLLAREWPCPVKVMNWGYWAHPGDAAASSEVYQRLSAIGVGQITAPEGIRALDELMAGPLPELALMKTEKPLAIDGLRTDEHAFLLSPESLPTPATARADARAAVDAGLSLGLKGATKATPPVDAALLRLLWTSLRSLGLFAGERMSDEDGSAVAPQYRRWLAKSLALLADAGYLERAAGVFRVARPGAAGLSDAWREWEEQRGSWGQDVHQAAQIRLAEACLRALPDILRGRRQATEVMFPDPFMSLVRGIYEGSSAANYFNDVLSEQVAAFVRERKARNPAAKVRILEIGSGTGATSRCVLERLEREGAAIDEYRFTDISRAFLLRADQELGARHRCLTFGLLDVERAGSGEAWDSGPYDLLLATNVLHATRNVRRTLRNAKRLMKRGGWILLNELSQATIFAHVTFGLLPGWWLPEDRALRIPDSPVLAPESWAFALGAEGFSHVAFPAEAAHSASQQVIVGVSDGVVWRPKELPSRSTTAAAPADPPAAHTPGSLPPADVDRSSDDRLRQRSVAFLKTVLGDVLKLPANKLQETVSFDNYGLDSILAVQITNALRKTFPDVSSTLLFEVQSIEALSEYFLADHREALREAVGAKPASAAPGAPPEATVTGRPAPDAGRASRPAPAASVAASAPQGRQPMIRRALIPDGDPHVAASAPRGGQPMDVAVVGLAGRYAQARNVNELWSALRDGKSNITEIPESRWPWRQYHREGRGHDGTIYSKWGGFIPEIDKFDPLFFQIAPREAELMDPQERLFLEVAYECLQDAGYTPANVAASRRVGVFVGIMNATYPVKPNYFSVANRVSYSFDLLGPSLAVDTACSSSATALHLALESVSSGASECAIAGGVNLVVTPQHYVNLCRLTMLSPSAQCKAFGDRADGFVDGEGVGAVLLKPLGKAIEDGDHIYGIIRGSAINAGGRTSGYTVPNPVAQAAVVAAALERSGLDARAVSYVEAHGTGTHLGDPIEVAGLSRAFAKHTSDRGFCAIGSVKSNIGHCESAAGIAGLTKILLQLKHGQIVPSLHAEVLNPNIEFDRTPFVVQRRLSEWVRPVLTTSGAPAQHPRVAGLSSFGAGGSNAHILVQEHVPAEDERGDVSRAELRPLPIVLSAKTREALDETVRRLLDALTEDAALESAQLEDVAYTLQVGREAMDERLGLVVESKHDLARKLRDLLDGKEGIDCYRGTVTSETAMLSSLSRDDDMRAAVARWLARGKLAQVLELWVKGGEIDWSAFHAGRAPRRISLPTYPFARKSYWITHTDSVAAGGVPPASQLPPASSPVIASEPRWLFVKEHWAAGDFASEIDWLGRWKRQSRLKIGIVYSDPMERDALRELLAGLHRAAGSEGVIALQTLRWEDVETAPWEPLPDVVFCLGDDGRRSSGPSSVRPVVQLGRALMRKAWEQPIRLYYVHAGGRERPRLEQDALSGFFASAMKENARHRWTMLSYDDGEREDGRFQRLVQEWLADDGAGEARFEWARVAGSTRSKRVLSETILAPASKPAFRDGAAYLVAGGFGPVGRLLCSELASRHRARLVVLGRGAPEERANDVRELEARGAAVRYLSVDISDPAALERAWALLKNDVGDIHGVIHLARSVEDGLIAVKPWESFERVIAAKVQGTVNLDRVTQAEPLEFFLLFSSIAAFGLQGGADYAYSAAFQNAFARHRNHLVGHGERRGRTFSQCWGPWEVDRYVSEGRDERFQARGFAMIGIEDAMSAIATAFGSEEPVLSVVKVHDPSKARGALGLDVTPDREAALPELEARLLTWERAHRAGADVSETVAKALEAVPLATLGPALVERLYALMFPEEDAAEKPAPAPAAPPPASRVPPAAPPPASRVPPAVHAPASAEPPAAGADSASVADTIATILVSVLKLESIDADLSLQSYGLDSLSAMQVATRLERKLGIEIPPQWLIEFPSVSQLSARVAKRTASPPAAPGNPGLRAQ